MGLSLVEGLVKSFLMILVSEIGDKTFFVAMLMAMRHNRREVLTGALSATWLMTIISMTFGAVAPTVIPAGWTDVAATALYFVFGIKSLVDGFNHTGNEPGEMASARAELDEAEARRIEDKEKGRKLPLSSAYMQTFAMTFFGEWGDRSQFATIGLAAQENAFGVTLGGMLGHLLCATFAVFAGDYVSHSFSEKMMSYMGGGLFLCFGVTSLATIDFHQFF
eukprot:SM000090S24348  [mRNA]  locus=s90:569218:572548:+ [translate_table: standard]